MIWTVVYLSLLIPKYFDGKQNNIRSIPINKAVGILNTWSLEINLQCDDIQESNDYEYIHYTISWLRYGHNRYFVKKGVFYIQDEIMAFVKSNKKNMIVNGFIICPTIEDSEYQNRLRTQVAVELLNIASETSTSLTFK
jgi:hypothetical protein